MSKEFYLTAAQAAAEIGITPRRLRQIVQGDPERYPATRAGLRRACMLPPATLVRLQADRHSPGNPEAGISARGGSHDAQFDAVHDRLNAQRADLNEIKQAVDDCQALCRQILHILASEPLSRKPPAPSTGLLSRILGQAGAVGDRQ